MDDLRLAAISKKYAHLNQKEVFADEKILRLFRMSSWYIMRDRFPSFVNLLIEKTSYLGTEASLDERLYRLRNHSARYTCIGCGIEVPFYRYNVGYKKFCSKECMYKSRGIKPDTSAYDVG